MTDHHPSRTASRTAVSGTVWAFVIAVSCCGAAVVARALVQLGHARTNDWELAAALALLTLAAGRFSIKVPGRPATVSVSEVFVFTSLILFGPAPATLTVALDGLYTSATQKRRRLYRGLFNVAEPAVSTWVAGTVFFAIARVPPLVTTHLGSPSLLMPTVVMTATYFVLNSVLQAAAVALESNGSPVEIWREHALYLGINYYAAASLATLAVHSTAGLNIEVVGLVAPLLVLSYAAYKVAASRIDDSQRHIRDVEHLYQATVETLAIAVDAKDQVTHGHIRRVQRHTITVARALGVAGEVELKALEAAALLHDVGKLAVPDYVLNKPGALSRREFDTIKRHATIGATILSTVEFPYPVVPIVRHHHEQWCGNGYPDGLAGEAIPLGARILTVVDCFDALTSDRPYRRRLTDEEATSVLLERRGTMYDPRVIDTFIGLIAELRREDARVDDVSTGIDEASPSRAASPEGTAAKAGADRSLPRPSLFDVIGPALTGKLARTMPDAEACLFALDTAEDLLVMAYATPLVRGFVKDLSLFVGEGLSGWVAANRHTIVNSPPDLDLGDVASAVGLRSCTSTPVFALGNLVGVLTVYLPRPRGFSEGDVLTIGALAQEIGLEVARYEHGFEFDTDYTHPAPLGVAR